MPQLLFEPEKTTTFECVMYVRDSLGNITDKTKTMKSDSAFKIWKFYMNNKGKPKRGKANPNKLPTAKQADKILVETYKDKSKYPDSDGDNK